jgi:ribonuclease VapC
MVVDTSALLAIIFEEAEAAVLAEILAASDNTLCSAVSVLEASIVVEARKGRAAGNDFHAFLDLAKIKVVEFSGEQAAIASQAWRRFGKGNHKAGLNMGDCCTYALSKVSRQALLFKGNDFSLTDLATVKY